MIPTLQAVKNNWNAFAFNYAKFMERSNVQLGLSLARMLDLHSAKNVLELCSGSGLLAFDLLQTLPPGIKYTSLDISEEMTRMANQRKESLLHRINHIDHSFITANAEDLSFILSESVDVALSSLCLHLTPEPNKALQEIMRVMKKGGRVGFSVLGDPEKSSFFQIFNDRVRECTIEQGGTKGRSAYHLGKRETLIKLAEENGIKVDFCWEEKVVMAIFDEEQFALANQTPANLRALSQFDEETQKKIMENVKKDFAELRRKNIPVEVDNLLLVGRK